MPNQSMAARPAASTPTDRGRVSSSEAISTSAKTGFDTADLAGGADGPEGTARGTADGARSGALDLGPATMRRAA